jgi:hypothetical protein
MFQQFTISCIICCHAQVEVAPCQCHICLPVCLLVCLCLCLFVSCLVVLLSCCLVVLLSCCLVVLLSCCLVVCRLVVCHTLPYILLRGSSLFVALYFCSCFSSSSRHTNKKHTHTHKKSKKQERQTGTSIIYVVVNPVSSAVQSSPVQSSPVQSSPVRFQTSVLVMNTCTIWS